MDWNDIRLLLIFFILSAMYFVSNGLINSNDVHPFIKNRKEVGRENQVILPISHEFLPEANSWDCI